MIRKGGSNNTLEGTYYGAPMRKWVDGEPVGTSANPDGTTTSGGRRKRKYKKKYTRRCKMLRRRTFRNCKTQKRKYTKRCKH